MSGELSPSEGSVKKHQHCTLGLYHQHSADVLDLNASPLAFLRKQFPTVQGKQKTEEWWRGYLATFGFSNELQQSPMGMLSDGGGFGIMRMDDGAPVSFDTTLVRLAHARVVFPDLILELLELLRDVDGTLTCFN